MIYQEYLYTVTFSYIIIIIIYIYTHTYIKSSFILVIKVVCLIWLIWVRLLWHGATNVCSGSYSKVELLDHILVLFLIWGTSSLIFVVAIPIYILINIVPVFHFLHILANTFYFLFSYFSLYKFYWSIVDLQCCGNFCTTNNSVIIYTYSLFFIFFSHIG